MQTNILVVEDDDVTRLTLVHRLRYAGYTVTEASSGEAAIDLLEGRQFNVVVTDILLGGLTGMDVLRVARSQPYRPEVIVLTGHGSFDTAIISVKEHAFDYLIKPAAGDLLLKTVEQAAVHHHSQTQLYAAARVLIAAALTDALPTVPRSADTTRMATELVPIAIGALRIGNNRNQVSFRDQPVKVTAIEYAILRFLAERATRVCLSRDIVAVSHQLYDIGDVEAQTILKPHIYNLRRKLAAEYIVTERGCGYCLIDPQ